MRYKSHLAIPDWTSLSVSSYDGSSDPSSILNSTPTASGKVNTVAIKSSSAITNARLGAAFSWRLKDYRGNEVTNPIVSVRLLLEVTSAPSATSDLWMVLGIGDNITPSSMSVYNFAGLHYDDTDGPDLRYGIITTQADTTANIGVVGALYDSSFGPTANANETQLFETVVWGLDSNGLRITSALTSTTVQTISTNPYIFLSFGRSSSAAGVATISFRASVFADPNLPRGFHNG